MDASSPSWSGLAPTTLWHLDAAQQGHPPHQVSRSSFELPTVGVLDIYDQRRDNITIHYVHQDSEAALDPWWSIGRTLERTLAIQGIGDRLAEVLAAVGLSASAARRYPHEFSGGQLRRVTLVRILALRPRLVILDESNSGLDMSVQAIC